MVNFLRAERLLTVQEGLYSIELQNVLVILLFLLVFVTQLSLTEEVYIQNIIRICTYPSHVNSSLPIIWTDESLLYLSLW
jgi:hypothetical protein